MFHKKFGTSIMLFMGSVCQKRMIFRAVLSLNEFRWKDFEFDLKQLTHFHLIIHKNNK